MKKTKFKSIFLASLVGILLVSGVLAVGGHNVSAQAGVTYYVSFFSGDDANTGLAPDEAWKTLSKVNSSNFSPGDTIAFARGDQWDEDLDIDSSGTVAQPITITSFGTGGQPVIRRITIDGDDVFIENIVVDHQKIASDAVRVRGKNVTLSQMIIRDGARDGVDASDADGLLIDSCQIHHFLAGSFTNQFDAHGVVATDIQGLTIRNTEIHHVSGDSFQADPSRSVNVPMDILIEDSHFWTGPLQADFNDWHAGEVPGENAIDTKVASDNWNNVDRATFTIRNIHAHGWISDGFISNRAVFNMKEKIEAVFDGVLVYDAEIAFRLRGTRGNANNTLANVLVYNVEKAIRVEDDLQNLKVFNSTFGSGIQTLLQIAGGGGGVGSWDFRNNAFLDTNPPAQASHLSNLQASPADFVNPLANDYHLISSSSLVDVGVLIPDVTMDLDGVVRPQGDGYDVGAYEFVPALTLYSMPGDRTIRLFWTINTSLPITSTWQLTYTGIPGDQPPPIDDLENSTSAYTLTGLANYTWYTITLNATLAGTPIMTATTTAMPTDIFVYLPVVPHLNHDQLD